MDPLERKVLGSTGLQVTQLGLGCAALGGLYGDIPDEQAHAVVQRALDLGLNLFDRTGSPLCYPLYKSVIDEVHGSFNLNPLTRRKRAIG